MDGMPCKKCLASFGPKSLLLLRQLSTQNIPKETHFLRAGLDALEKKKRRRFVDLYETHRNHQFFITQRVSMIFACCALVQLFSICIAPTSQRLPTTLYPAKSGISHILRCCHATFLVVHAFPLKLSTTVAKIKTWKSKNFLRIRQ